MIEIPGVLDVPGYDLANKTPLTASNDIRADATEARSYMASPYHQAELQASSDNIRLLELLEGAQPPDSSVDQAELAGIFHTVSVASAPEYLALSYEWTTAPTNCTISVNGRRISVRENLYNALRHVLEASHNFWVYITKYHACPTITDRQEQSSGPLLIWIDALCIDQSNTGERNHQVQMMSKIYAGAQSVIVWLGLNQDDSHIIFEAATAYRDRSFVDEDLTEDSRSVIFIDHEQSGPSDVSRKGEDQFNRPRLSDDSQSQNRLERGIVLLMTRNYWRRLWIVQEIVLARDLFVLCGSNCLAWNALATYLGRQLDALDFDLSLHQDPGSESHPAKSSNFDRTCHQGRRITTESLIWRETRPQAAIDLRQTPGMDMIRNQAWWCPEAVSFQLTVQTWGARECEDTRDKVFGILGVFKYPDDPMAGKILPNYDQSVEELYGTICQELLETFKPRFGVSNLGLSVFAKRFADILQVCRAHPAVKAVEVEFEARLLPKDDHSIASFKAIKRKKTSWGPSR